MANVTELSAFILKNNPQIVLWYPKKKREENKKLRVKEHPADVSQGTPEPRGTGRGWQYLALYLDANKVWGCLSRLLIFPAASTTCGSVQHYLPSTPASTSNNCPSG